MHLLLARNILEYSSNAMYYTLVIRRHHKEIQRSVPGTRLGSMKHAKRFITLSHYYIPAALAGRKYCPTPLIKLSVTTSEDIHYADKNSRAV
jgi:hypothetical protein